MKIVRQRDAEELSSNLRCELVVLFAQNNKSHPTWTAKDKLKSQNGATASSNNNLPAQWNHKLGADTGSFVAGGLLVISHHALGFSPQQSQLCEPSVQRRSHTQITAVSLFSFAFSSSSLPVRDIIFIAGGEVHHGSTSEMISSSHEPPSCARLIASHRSLLRRVLGAP